VGEEILTEMIEFPEPPSSARLRHTRAAEMEIEGVVFREIRPGDVVALVDVYRDAVRHLGPQCYGESEIAVWSRCPEDIDDFAARLRLGVTLVAEAEGRPVAFGQLSPMDYVAFLYCRGSHARRGIASRICAALEARARADGQVRLHTLASRLSRHVFGRQGFEVTQVEVVVRHGVELECFRMTKRFG
jgi:putative acetyltransferase